MGARRVKAPPGKLGIVIDTSEDGPVVKLVKENSPLEGLVFPDDLIVAVGSTETKGMTGAELTTLMAGSGRRDASLDGRE